MSWAEQAPILSSGSHLLTSDWAFPFVRSFYFHRPVSNECTFARIISEGVRPGGRLFFFLPGGAAAAAFIHLGGKGPSKDGKQNTQDSAVSGQFERAANVCLSEIYSARCSWRPTFSVYKSYTVCPQICCIVWPPLSLLCGRHIWKSPKSMWPFKIYLFYFVQWRWS